MYAKVLWASFDQCSKNIVGNNACSHITIVIANWLLSNPSHLPSRKQFHKLIKEGSKEWNRMCKEDTYKKYAPEGDFDIPIAVKAGIRPMAYNNSLSFFGFIKMRGFEERSTKFGYMKSLDTIWDSVKNEDKDVVYIVGYFCHWFLLKVRRVT